MLDPLALEDFVENWQSLRFEPFREGVDIAHLKTGSPAVAVLRYAPGAGVPRHLHTGLETILVLDGVARSPSTARTSGADRRRVRFMMSGPGTGPERQAGERRVDGPDRTLSPCPTRGGPR